MYELVDLLAYDHVYGLVNQRPIQPIRSSDHSSSILICSMQWEYLHTCIYLQYLLIVSLMRNGLKIT